MEFQGEVPHILQEDIPDILEEHTPLEGYKQGVNPALQEESNPGEVWARTLLALEYMKAGGCLPGAHK